MLSFNRTMQELKLDYPAAIAPKPFTPFNRTMQELKLSS